jgi:putative membrane protein insertion efficiency factor
MSIAAWLLALPIKAYRHTLAPFLGVNCRFAPSCSAYAIEALAKHGAARGLWLGARRVSRCHPWGGDGYDPVPER